MESASFPRQNHLENMAALKSSEYPTDWNNNGTIVGVCIMLVVAVFLVFGQTLQHGFINYDDSLYFSSNPPVQAGLTWKGVSWAFRTGHASNWHPLTWLSLMFDVEMFGTDPAGPHLMNVILHAVNAVLLFLLLRRLMRLRSDASSPLMVLRSHASVGVTGTPAGTLWSCAFVAAVFAIHPLRVESVAWVAERKDVLSGLFFMLTLLFYARYVQKAENGKLKAESGGRFPSSIFHPLFSSSYWLALLFFALGLMSKPMLVTVPFVLLLLDWWPLERFTIHDSRFTIRCLIWEKIPFFGLSAASCVATVLAQREAIKSTIVMPFTLRSGNALISYVTYIGQMFWPDNLVVFYPYRFDIPTWQVAIAGLLLLFITLLAFRTARRFPYFITGWLWYLGMLVPVIGLMQVGDQSHADRYTYLSQIGLYLVMVLAIKDWTVSWRYRRQVLGAAMGIVIAALMVCSWRQTSYWSNSESLWAHTLDHTSGNYVAHNDLGVMLGSRGQLDEAIEHFQKALEIRPDYPEGHNNLGIALRRKGRLDEAIEHFKEAVKIAPTFADAYYNLGNALMQNGRLGEAMKEYRKALDLAPRHLPAHLSLAWLLATGPEASLRNGQKAMELAQQAEQLSGGTSPEILDTLAAAYAEAGRYPEAVETARQALSLPATQNNPSLADAIQARLKLYEAGSPYHAKP
jgi:tetratricopeptide (TPR) repeat protein